MLKNVWHTGVIRRIRLEADAEDIVAVVASDVKMLGARLVMLQVQRCQLKLWNMLAAEQSKSVKLLAGLWVLRDLCDSSLSRVYSTAQDSGRHDCVQNRHDQSPLERKDTAAKSLPPSSRLSQATLRLLADGRVGGNDSCLVVTRSRGKAG